MFPIIHCHRMQLVFPQLHLVFPQLHLVFPQLHFVFPQLHLVVPHSPCVSTAAPCVSTVVPCVSTAAPCVSTAAPRVSTADCWCYPAGCVKEQPTAHQRSLHAGGCKARRGTAPISPGLHQHCRQLLPGWRPAQNGVCGAAVPGISHQRPYLLHIPVHVPAGDQPVPKGSCHGYILHGTLIFTLETISVCWPVRPSCHAGKYTWLPNSP